MIVDVLKTVMEATNRQRKAAAQNMRLGDFIKALEARPQDQQVAFDFCGFTPSEFKSYRGFYEDLSLTFSVDGPNGKKVSDLLAEARAANGAEFTGYKGGEFMMDEQTLLWAAPYGRSYSTAITGVTGDDFQTIIETVWMRQH